LCGPARHEHHSSDDSSAFPYHGVSSSVLTCQSLARDSRFNPVLPEAPCFAIMRATSAALQTHYGRELPKNRFLWSL
jgi:hypothetical protein